MRCFEIGTIHEQDLLEHGGLSRAHGMSVDHASARSLRMAEIQAATMQFLYFVIALHHISMTFAFSMLY